MPLELVTPTVYGSSSTHWNGTTIVLERSRPSSAGPSSSNGTTASSTVTAAIVSFGGCGFVTRIRISPGTNSTRRMSNRSTAGGRAAGHDFPPPDVESGDGGRSAADEVEQRVAGRREERDDPDEQQQREERPEPPRAGPQAGRDLGGGHQSSTSKNPIQPSSVNSDWCAWNMNRPVFAKSISMIPRCPWQSMTVSVYSKWSLEPVG